MPDSATPRPSLSVATGPSRPGTEPKSPRAHICHNRTAVLLITGRRTVDNATEQVDNRDLSVDGAWTRAQARNRNI